MTVAIKHRFSGEVICTGETVLDAVRSNLANLYGADLRGADLRGANLRGANLRDADLRGIMVAWNSHDLLAELLKRSAGDDLAKLKVAGLVLICRETCWREFLSMEDPLAGWALGVLSEWVKDGDEAPEAVRAAKRSEPASEAG